MREGHKLVYFNRGMKGTGWLPSGATHRNLNPALKGFMIAHDILEHQNGGQGLGTIEDELEAFGAIWLTRGQHYHLFTPNQSPQSVIDYYYDNLHYLWRQYTSGKQKLAEGAVLVEHQPLDGLIREVWHNMQDRVFWAHENESQIEWFIHCANHFMHVGYQKALKRFGTAQDAKDTFWNLEQEIDHVLDNAEHSINRDMNILIEECVASVYLGKYEPPSIYRKFQKGS